MVVAFQTSRRDDQAGMPAQDARRVRQMRRLARARLGYCGLSCMAPDVELIVSELVTNAIEHNHGASVSMSLRLAKGTVRIEVSDGSPCRPQKRRPTDDDEGGRGLLLVAGLADDWGVSDDGTTTWCTLSLTEGPSDMEPAAAISPASRQITLELPAPMRPGQVDL
jgi:anti-sigma regulatory factor (Ser/Thr protein kinase)